MKKNGFRSINTKLLVILLPVIFASLAAVSWIGYQTSTNIINSQIETEMKNKLDIGVSTVEDVLTNHAKIAETLAKTAQADGLQMQHDQYVALTKSFVSLNADTFGDGVWFEPYKYKPDAKYFGPYAYKDSGSIVYTDDYNTADYDYPHWDWYKIGMNTNKPVVWSAPYLDSVTKITMVTATAPFYDQSGKFLGVATADIDLTGLQKQIAALKIGTNGKAILLDNKGIYLSDADASKIMNVKISSDPDKSLAALSGDLLSGKRSFGEFTDSHGVNDIYYAPVPETGWVLAISVPHSELYKPVQDLVGKLAAFAAAFIAVLGLIVLLAVRSFTRPVRSITGLLEHAQLGDFSADLPAKLLNRHDEIGRLAASYSSMAQHMRGQIDAASMIAQGDMKVSLDVSSNQDHLSQSILTLRDTISALTDEVGALTGSVARGDFSIRGDAARFKGEYRAMIDGVNGLLAKMEATLKEQAQAGVIAEKKARYQQEEVRKILVNLDRLSKGELFCDMKAAAADLDTQDLHDMFSSIGETLASSIGAIKEYIREISSKLEEMSSGAFDVEIRSDYVGDFVALKDSINSIADTLSRTMLEIGISADQVASGTQQVSAGSQALSQGATEQASATEQLTASLAEIANQTKQNAMNASRASELASTARDSAVSGNTRMKELQQAMGEINDASMNISKIIKVIDDIAFQTNLLALNAAVEAARAGQHGKGFAVVAEEVRSLAGRSAAAAKETTAMIEESIKKVKAGTRIANETEHALNEIVGGVEAATRLISGIAQASSEQATAVSQVNRGIEQVSQVTQTNSATAEQSAAASEELSSQAETLKQMVGRFSLRGQGLPGGQKASFQPAAGPKALPGAKPQGKPRISLGDREFGKY